MAVVEEILRVASKLGKPEEVLTNALKKEVIAKIIELENIVEKMERNSVSASKNLKNKTSWIN